MRAVSYPSNKMKEGEPGLKRRSPGWSAQQTRRAFDCKGPGAGECRHPASAVPGVALVRPPRGLYAGKPEAAPDLVLVDDGRGVPVADAMLVSQPVRALLAA